MTIRDALRIVFRREYLRRTVRIALVVGTILTLINQLDVFINGTETTLTWIKTGLNFCVPFVGLPAVHTVLADELCGGRRKERGIWRGVFRGPTWRRVHAT